MAEKMRRARKGLGVSEERVIDHIDRAWAAMWFLAEREPPDKEQWKKEVEERRKRRQGG